jgi:hypothetical protein
LLVVIAIVYLLLNLFAYLLLQQLFAYCCIYLHCLLLQQLFACCYIFLHVIIGAQFLLASKLRVHFTSSPMELITINLQLANLLWIWSCMNLLLLSMFCKESNLMYT